MRCALKYIVLAALTVAAVITIYALDRPNLEPGVELDRPGEDPVALWEGYTQSRTHPIDGIRGCLTLDDGRDFACLTDTDTSASAESASQQ